MFEMSLFYPLTHNLNLWPDAYGCPVDFQKSNISWPIYGTYLMTSGIIFMILYIPCFISLIKHKGKTPAYQLMLILAVIDILSLFTSSLASGFLSFYGIHFCDSPLFFFIIGDFASGAWMTGCLASILLGMERCTETNPKFLFSFLFEKNVFRVVKFVLLGYGIYSMVFNKPLFFNPDCSCFLFDPMIGKDIVLQGVILCFFHASAALIYEYMQHFYSPQWLIITGHVVWQWSSGCLCIAYLTLNRTIRDAVLKMVLPKFIRKKLGLYIGVEEHLALENGSGSLGIGGKLGINPGGPAVKVDNFFPG
ncbi:hypothetical protein B9Z55_018018 [Caenorhabditis nigoni]|nr:hypothetical protein B9Z55_018018 [Caenorhabditis nigoni]